MIDKRLKLAYIGFLIVLLLGGILIAFDGNRWLSMPCLGIAIFLSWYLVQNFLTYVQRLVQISNHTLNKKGDSNTNDSLKMLDELSQNQRLMAEKFKISAELITNLAQPEKLDSAKFLGENDPIAKALEKIKIEMQHVKAEDEMRAWVTQGLARFGEILRNKLEIKEYAYAIISHLIKYLGANQGGLFIENITPQGERYMELASFYAYSKRKYLEDKVFPGIGLLGQCMLEQDFIFITDVPDDYIKITSGLGQATAKNIVVAPLIFNETFCGAIEIASFEILQPHQMEFLRKVCEDIASEIASLKNVAHTKKLLEESNMLAHELQSREEVMKQSMEELAATQEEMVHKQSELSGIINAIDSTLATAELNAYGKIVKNNAILDHFLSYSEGQLIGKDYSTILGLPEGNWSWDQIIGGNITSGDFKTRSKKSIDVWLSITFTPISGSDGRTLKLLCMIQDITQKKLKEAEFERLSLVADNTDNAVVITDKDGLIEYVNGGFRKMTMYSLEEVIGRKPGTVLQGEDSNKETIRIIREKLKKRESVYEEILNYDKNHQPYWVSLAINPVFDEKGELNRFISVQANITETKKSSLDFKYKLEAISRSNTIIEFDANGYILDANENFLELTEYSLDEIKGKHHQIFLLDGEADKPEYKRFWEKLAAGEFVSNEYQRKTKSGKLIWLRGIYNPILDMNGQTKKIVKFAVDITEEKRLQLVNQRKQKELNSYLGGINNTIASAEFEPNGIFKEANDIFLKVMGYENSELLGRNVSEIMGEDPKNLMMWENLRLGQFFSGEFKFKNKAGKELWLIGTFNPITIDGDKPEKIMMFAQFTTQEKEKLNDLNTLVHAFKSTLPVIEFHPDYSCKSANEKAMKLFGWSRLELKSKSIQDIISPSYHPMWKKKKEETLNADFSTISLPLQINGQDTVFDVSISVSHNLDGTLGKIIMILVKDIKDHGYALAAN